MLILIKIINLKYQMGSKDSKQIERQSTQTKNKKEIDMMYRMFDETINMVQDYRINLSQINHQNSQKKSNVKISNLTEVIEQLLQSFSSNKKYGWSQEIYREFKKHFSGSFQDAWNSNKEDFYRIILAQCKFQTLDFQEQLNQIAQNKKLQKPNRDSYQKFFYQVGANRLQSNLPSSLIDHVDWEQDLAQQNQEEKNQFNLNAINATIINNQFDPAFYQKSLNRTDDSDLDFLPLFINKKGNKNLDSANKSQKGSLSALKGSISSSSEKKTKDKIREAHIQNSSVIAPETIFLNRLNQDVKKQIGDLVRFYRQFGNALQMMFFSVTLLSVPFKHFTFLLTEKMTRKKISNKKKVSRSYPIIKGTFSQSQKLFYGSTEEAYRYRQRRQINNNLLLDEIKDFSVAYTEYIWKYLQLSQITELKLGKLISSDAVYGIVLKSVWKFVEFISQRGYEYQEWKIEQFFQVNQIPSNSKVTQEKKRYLMRILKTLKGETSPQKYLKKIVIFYREVSNVSECADDLLVLYEELLVRIIKDRGTRQLGIFRMKHIIESVLNISESQNSGGEIGYSWTTWCIIVQLFEQKVGKSPYKSMSQVSNIQTQADVQFYYQDDAS